METSAVFTAQDAEQLARLMEKLGTVAQAFHARPVPQDSPLWTYEELAEYTSLSRGYLMQLVSAGQIPSYLLTPQARRFKREEIEAWVEARRA